MGGFLSWRVGNTLPVLLGLWPVIALSGTLAGEAAKGSLDLLASTPQSRRTIALEKLAGHVTAVADRDADARDHASGSSGRPSGPCPATRSRIGGPRPGRPVRGDDAGGRGRRFRDRAVARTDSRDGVRAHRPVRELPHLQLRARCRRSSTASSRCRSFGGPRATGPMAGVSDWPSVAALAAITIVLFAIGVVGFVRRDLGGVANVGLAAAALAAGRHRADRSPDSSPTGRASPSPGVSGIGLYGILIVASADAFSDMIANAAADRRPHRDGLPGPRPDPAVGRPPADVLRLRLVHHRPVGRHVPGRLGRRRGTASPRGRPVDAAIAGLVGVAERARGHGRDRRRDPVHRPPHRHRGRRSRVATSSTRSRASASWALPLPRSPGSVSRSVASCDRRWRPA